MALQVTKVLVDDLDGTKETVKSVKTRRFTIDGTQFEIDLCDDNHEALLKAVETFVAKARVISRPKKVSVAEGPGRSKKAQARIDRAQLDHMRDWCRSHGYDVSSYGRIPLKYEQEYHKAHPVRTSADQQGAESSQANGNSLFSSV